MAGFPGLAACSVPLPAGSLPAGWCPAAAAHHDPSSANACVVLRLMILQCCPDGAGAPGAAGVMLELALQSGSASATPATAAMPAMTTAVKAS